MFIVLKTVAITFTSLFFVSGIYMIFVFPNFQLFGYDMFAYGNLLISLSSVGVLSTIAAIIAGVRLTRKKLLKRRQLRVFYIMIALYVLSALLIVLFQVLLFLVFSQITDGFSG